MTFSPLKRALLGLDLLNFTLADVRDGLGPFLAIYLMSTGNQNHFWNEDKVGWVMMIAGLLGILAQVPSGALVDASRYKRSLLIGGAVGIASSSIVLPLVTHSFILVTLSQAVAATAAVILAPLLVAVSLGVVGAEKLTRRVGRNEMFNHIGNTLTATIAAISAAFYGPIVIFWLLALMALLSIGATLLIPASTIDHNLARGRLADAQPHDLTFWQTLTSNRHLLIFALTCFFFHLANGAMLISVGQLLTHQVGRASATSFAAACIVSGQIVMVAMAIMVGHRADIWGRKKIFLAGFAVLALRGCLYPFSNDPYYLVAVQCLDGVGAGIYAALFPLVVADLTRGTGRFNISQGAVATMQGIGAALSPGLSGFIIVHYGYTANFLTLAAIAATGLLLYLCLMPETLNLRQA